MKISVPRNPVCPKCDSKHTLAITYGYPTRAAISKTKKGEVYWGGCCIADENFHCNSCGHDFVGKVSSREIEIKARGNPTATNG